jgi:hypothetical protein
LVDFKDIPVATPQGCFAPAPTPWTTPDSQMVTITAGQTLTVTGAYTQGGKALAANVTNCGTKGDLVLMLCITLMLTVRRKAAIPRGD